MSARLLAFWDDIRSSYWFIPTLMVLAAIALSFVTTTIDGRIGAGWIENVSWLYGNKPDGARGLLSTVAGSMIGVAGVTFSITIASVVYASGQYGPRLLTNFMQDRGNQITLGTFIATFLYCLLVLRTVRAADEVTGGDNPAGDVVGAFVPHVAIATALVLVLASVGVLIFFIHHVPHSIHVSNLIAGVGGDLEKHINMLFPRRIGEGRPDEETREDDEIRTDLPEDFVREADPICADSAGYIQGVSEEGLIDIAREHDLLIRMRRRPGDFVAEGDVLVLAWPSSRVDQEVRDRLRIAFAWGSQRSAVQDARFLVNELVEIAARALSPGVNDPFTAITCLDWLGAALKTLTEREFPSVRRYDEEGALRVIAEPTTFEEFVQHVFGQLRPYAASDRNAALHALRVLGEIGGRTENPDHRASLRRQADALHEGAQSALTLEADRLAVAEKHRLVVRILSGVPYSEIAAQSDWIGGSA